MPHSQKAIPNDVQWFDFHRHLPVDDKALRSSILSFSLYELAKIPPEPFYTIALHPWDTARLDAVKLVENALPKLLASPRCLALGECGLDRIRGAALPVQLELLAQQLAIAREAKKPLVVHCVRAWGELAAQVRRSRFNGTKAIHGFRGNESILKQLVAQDWYISVGLNAHGHLPTATLAIPSERILLESDSSNVAIQSVYKAYAELKGISITETLELIKCNMLTFFGIQESELSAQ